MGQMPSPNLASVGILPSSTSQRSRKGAVNFTTDPQLTFRFDFAVKKFNFSAHTLSEAGCITVKSCEPALNALKLSDVVPSLYNSKSGLHRLNISHPRK